MSDLNFIGCALYVSAALPAANTKAGFEALSWTRVKGLVTGPQLSYTHEVIEIPDLGTGFKDAEKGMGGGTDTQFSYRYIASDPGQAIVAAQAIDQNGTCSVKFVQSPSGTDGGDGPEVAAGDEVEYAQGFMHSYMPNQPDGNTYRGSTVSFRTRKEPVSDVEPTP